MSKENAHADRARAGFFEGFDLAEADDRGKFIALADYAFGGCSATIRCAADHVEGERFKIGRYLRTFESSRHFKFSFHHRGTETLRKANSLLRALAAHSTLLTKRQVNELIFSVALW